MEETARAWRDLHPLMKEGMLLLLGLSAVWAGGLLFRYFWQQVLSRVARRTSTTLDELLLASCWRPARILAWLLLLNLLLRTLGPLWLPQTWRALVACRGSDALYIACVGALTWLVYAVVAGLCDWYLHSIAERTQSRIDDQMIPVVRRLSKVVLIFLAATIVLENYQVDLTAVLGAAGIASLAVALAAQDTIANMIAGFTLLADQPFRVGDRVQLGDGRTGDVVEIGLRSTKILALDNTMVVVPNSEIAKAQIVNFSYPDPRFRILHDVGVSYGSDMEKVRRALLEVCASHSTALKEPPAEVSFVSFGDSALNLRISCWIPDFRKRFAALDELNRAILERFRADGIEIPFPQRDLHLRSVQAPIPLAPPPDGKRG